MANPFCGVGPINVGNGVTVDDCDVVFDVDAEIDSVVDNDFDVVGDFELDSEFVEELENDGDVDDEFDGKISVIEGVFDAVVDWETDLLIVSLPVLDFEGLDVCDSDDVLVGVIVLVLLGVLLLVLVLVPVWLEDPEDVALCDKELVLDSDGAGEFDAVLDRGGDAEEEGNKEVVEVGVFGGVFEGVLVMLLVGDFVEDNDFDVEDDEEADVVEDGVFEAVLDCVLVVDAVGVGVFVLDDEEVGVCVSELDGVRVLVIDCVVDAVPEFV